MVSIDWQSLFKNTITKVAIHSAIALLAAFFTKVFGSYLKFAIAHRAVSEVIQSNDMQPNDVTVQVLSTVIENDASARVRNLVSASDGILVGDDELIRINKACFAQDHHSHLWKRASRKGYVALVQSNFDTYLSRFPTFNQHFSSELSLETLSVRIIVHDKATLERSLADRGVKEKISNYFHQMESAGVSSYWLDPNCWQISSQQPGSAVSNLSTEFGIWLDRLVMEYYYKQNGIHIRIVESKRDINKYNNYVIAVENAIRHLARIRLQGDRFLFEKISDEDQSTLRNSIQPI
jgi:hypothetical protein